MAMDMDIVMDACRVVPYRFKSYVWIAWTTVFVYVAYVSFKHVFIVSKLEAFVMADTI